MLDQAEEDCWLTYAEAGELLGVSAEAVRVRARRQKWPRRTPNERGAVARVLVPPDVRRTDESRPGGQNGHDRADSVPDMTRSMAILEAPVADLRTRLDASDGERREVQAKLDDAMIAAQIERDEAAGLRTRFDQLQARGLWARLRNKMR